MRNTGGWPRAAALAWLVLASACTLLPLGEGRTASPGGYVSPMGEGLREFRVVFHCHCWLSHDSDGTLDEIAGAAQRLGFNAVILNDHYAPGNVAKAPRGFHQGVLFIPGLEQGLAGGGSILSIAPRHDPTDDAATPEQQVRALRDDGALLVAGHVERLAPECDLAGFEGFEVYNLHAEFTQAAWWRIALRFFALLPDGFFEASITTPEAQLARWDRELALRPLVPLAGHDAHANVRAFGPLGGTIGTYGEVFRLFSNRVLAPTLTEAALVDALRKGRVYIAFDHLGDPRGFAASYGASGASGAILGDTAPYRPEHRLRVRLPRAARLRIVCVGGEVRELEGDSFELALPGPGTYRLEVYLADRLWILTSPIRLDAPRP